MDMKELKYLTVLAEEESISRAAERLYMAQSSLSQFLHQFESEIGTKLFVRTSKGITPTLQWKKIYRACPGDIARISEGKE